MIFISYKSQLPQLFVRKKPLKRSHTLKIIDFRIKFFRLKSTELLLKSIRNYLFSENNIRTVFRTI